MFTSSVSICTLRADYSEFFPIDYQNVVSEKISERYMVTTVELVLFVFQIIQISNVRLGFCIIMNSLCGKLRGVQIKKTVKKN